MLTPLTRAGLVVLLAGGGALLAGCGDHIDVPGPNGYATASVSPAGGAGSPTAEPSVAAPSTTAAPAATSCAPITPNPPAKGEPTVPPVAAPPSSLVTKDIKVGSGPAAKAGDTVSIAYVGISCSTGKAFDASYTDGNGDFSFALGQGQVIPGFDQGIAGMHQGGVREIVIPPALGYGAAGSGPIGPNETLIFVVTLDKA